MDISGMFGKLESNADKLGAIVGVFGALSEHKWTPSDPLGKLMIIFDQLMKDPHFPDMSHVWAMMTHPNNPTFRTAIAAMIGGYVLGEIDGGPQINRIAAALQKGGMGAAMGAFALNVLVYSGAGHSPITTGSGGAGGLSSMWGA